MATATVPSTATPIRTDKVVGRRELHFNTLDDIRQEALRLSRGQVKMLGNWSLGQVYLHLAKGMTMAIDGAAFKVPWYFRIIGRLMKKGFLAKKMPPGFKLPEKAMATLGPGEISTEAGLEALLAALDRLERTSTRAPSPFLGPMTIEDSTRLQCRHAELHLSFAVPV